jgi:hypothetical protein
MLVAAERRSRFSGDTGYYISKSALGVRANNIQHPGSRNISNDFYQNTLIARKHFIAIEGYSQKS